MSAPVRAKHICSFCNRDLDEVEFLVKSAVGGLPPEICSVCIEQLSDLVAAYRRSPAEAAALIHATNRVAAEIRAGRSLEMAS